MNLLVLALQSPYLEAELHDHVPICAALPSLCARCSPDRFGHPERSPLAEAVARNDIEVVSQLLAFIQC